MIFLFSGLLTFIIEFSSTDLKHKTSPQASADTYIPYGFVLVPIEVQNLEVLDAILGQFGVVDLFIPPQAPGKNPQLIARQVRIIRAPLNPQKFAILSPESEASSLVRQSRPFIVVVQNPNQKEMKFSKILKKKRHVFVENL